MKVFNNQHVMIYVSRCLCQTMAMAIVLWSGLSPEESCAADKKWYCSGIYNCLQQKLPSCDEEACQQKPGIEYDDDFCTMFLELKKRGLDPETFWGRRIYSYLSRQHRITYMIEGSMPLAAEILRYLMNDLPFAAQLINAYKGTTYSASYTDPAHKQFRGDNGGSLSGIFTTITQDPAQNKTVYFGYGTAKILMWRLNGTALILLDIEPDNAGSVNYRLTCMVFPSNRFVRSILDFVLFRKAMTGIFRDMIANIRDTALQFSKGNTAPLEKYPAFNCPEGRKEIADFQRVVQGANHQPPGEP
jgi:hypothetical protein